MINSLRFIRTVLSLPLCVALSTAFALSAYAQDEIGGPYEPDTATVLLMHFDGNLENASDQSADGVGHGNLTYVSNAALGLGQALRLDNDAQNDSSYVTIADDEALDLQGNWTIEGWINIFTFGETADDWRWVPRLIIKPGEEVFWRPNYWIELWGDNRFFSSGYHSATGCCWPQANTPNDTMEPGSWYHIAFVRDTTEQIIAQVVHDSNMELIAFSSYQYDPIDEAPPMTNDNAVHIGWAGATNIATPSTDSWLDGFVDEIRVSNVVRNFNIPPILTSVTELANQPSDQAGYEISVEAFKLGSGEISDVTLHYDVGNGFQEVAMSSSGGRTYTAMIPEQDLGTVIRYFVSATDETDLRSTYPSNVETTEAYFSFGVYEENTQTLRLTFEEGTGVPQDHSQYAHTVETFGSPTYVEEAAAGDYALDFDSGDSTYLEIESPFLASNEMSVELWFNADSMDADVRLIGKESPGGTWYNQNFEMKFMAGHRLAAGTYLPDGSGYIINDLYVEDSLVTGTWYQALYVLSADSALLRISDAEGEVIGEKRMAVEGSAILAGGPFRLGHSGPADQGYFDGRIDNVVVYNYALDVFATDAETGTELPKSIALEQNYPNPFNPATTIRYSLPMASDVTLAVFDVLGRRVATLVDQQQTAGRHEVQFDGAGLASGIYYYQLRSETQTRVRTMMLLK